ATWVSADASRVGYRKLAESIEGVPSVDITPRSTGRWDGSGVPKLTDIPGVRAVVPLVYKPSLLRSDDRRVREVAVGVDVRGLVDAGFLKLVDGEACETPDEVVLSRTLADSLDKKVGDTVTFLARRGGYRTMTIVGIADTQSLTALSDGGGVVVEIESLGELTGVRGVIDRFRLVLHPDASRQAVLEAVAKRLPENLTAMVPAGRASMAHDMLNAANLGLDFVTALTVAMAWFIVGNAMLMNVTERRRSFALQRVLGATKRQIGGMLFAEAAAIGVVGAAAGAAGGLLAAGPISRGIAQAIRAPDFQVSYNPWIVVAAVLIGPAVAVLAAWWPSRQAAKVDLLESLAHMLCQPCPTCEGRGQVKTARSVCYDILREILREARQFNPREFRVVANAGVVEMLLDEESVHLA
ncbi:MAG: FtsX-like permease family protein, partial [Actinobacteria bacterium]|nr:FtsX-like permease family protein [Actinomycetota bacterium]